MITQADARQQVRRLVAAGYGLSKGATEDGVAELWAGALDMRPGEFEQAVGQYVKSGGRYFPRPGDLIEIVRDLRSSSGSSPSDLQAQYNRWEQHPEGPCPVCGAVIQQVSADQRGGVSAGPPRLGALHDWREHKLQKVPYVGWPHKRATRED